MKALVLAGGSGTRLRPFSHTMAKQLVPVANKPVLRHVLEAVRDAGVTDVGVIVGSRGAEIRQAIGDGDGLGLDLTFIPQEAPLGLAHCVVAASEFLAGESFMMYLGDNIIVDGLAGFVREFQGSGADAQILLSKVPDPEHYGIAEVDAQGRIIGLVEKPARPKSDLAVVGLYLFGPAIHTAVRSIQPSRRGELEITDAVQWLIERGGAVRSHLLRGYWKDTGRVDDVLECNRAFLEGIAPAMLGKVDADTEVIGRVSIGRDVTVQGSRLVGPLIIGDGSTVVDSHVGPFTSIGAGCHIEGASMDYSILMESVTVRGIRGLHGSVIGRQSTLSPPASALRTSRIVTGDHSHLQIFQH
ncbi:glucose-1-phosphate thymidylyltransferase [Sphaerisporangium sp. TRM90804]|uniref:glucose-1-phosphate thymidylyltransferase n=1 Tax=Sphaerisporangium sp. TRM90804 TaxID=3031113 RepID=UPI00244C752D|nr:glucose-1-phosphate thymidylyltransferase [Sphaerisporangium sp. TRM90804]MDH2427219.1 glucose-1-phosphate thymidylyltransferase [Sphaerisporangium sp. TRM90804]